MFEHLVPSWQCGLGHCHWRKTLGVLYPGALPIFSLFPECRWNVISQLPASASMLFLTGDGSSCHHELYTPLEFNCKPTKPFLCIFLSSITAAQKELRHNLDVCLLEMWLSQPQGLYDRVFCSHKMNVFVVTTLCLAAGPMAQSEKSLQCKLRSEP